MIEAVVDSIRVSLVTQARVVILKEVGGQRHLPIWIGPFEAEAIAMQLQGIESSRPLPYDLLRTVIAELGGEVRRITITEINNDVYYARILINTSAGNGEGVEIDSRPSDAIALAVRVGLPIMIDNAVMDRAGVNLEDEEDESEEATGEGETASAQVSTEGLTAFRDFINSLDLDDFGKKRDN